MKIMNLIDMKTYLRKTFKSSIGKQVNIDEHEIPLQENGIIKTKAAKAKTYSKCCILCSIWLSILLNVLFARLILSDLLLMSTTETCDKNALFLPCTYQKAACGFCKYEATSSLIRLVYIISAVKYTTSYDEDRIKHQRESKNRVSANLLLDTMIDTRSNRLKWSNERGYGSAFTTSGVPYKDGNVIVPVNGMYLVYNVLSIKTESQKKKEQLTHTVFVTSREHKVQNKILLQINFPRIVGYFTYQMSDMLGVVKLMAGDKLFTTISNISSIYHERFTSVFGLYWMGAAPEH